MAKTAAKKSPAKRADLSSTHGSPKFPYTIVPGALRRFLTNAPNKPKPSKVDLKLLKAWGDGNNNASTIVSVLKTVGLLDGSGAPTTIYEKYMTAGNGPAVLAEKIREVYSGLFETSHQPYNDGQAALKNYFNIHSGGGERTIEYQIQTFKVLCEFADFSAKTSDGVGVGGQHHPPGGSGITPPAGQGTAVHINVHIHLPENKSRADYEEIIKDLGKYIFGK